MKKNQIEYYNLRAKEYDLVYNKPERQVDLEKIKKRLITQFNKQRVLEIACGTGYWTQFIAQSAQSILATDINPAVLDIAKSRTYNTPVSFEQIDLNDLIPKSIPYDALFGGFIYSHILREDLDSFVSILFNQIKSGGQLMFIDNQFVEGNSTPLFRKNENNNTFQQRVLSSGEKYEVVKNYPTKTELLSLFEPYIHELQWIELSYYWIAIATKK